MARYGSGEGDLVGVGRVELRPRPAAAAGAAGTPARPHRAAEHAAGGRAAEPAPAEAPEPAAPAPEPAAAEAPEPAAGPAAGPAGLPGAGGVDALGVVHAEDLHRPGAVGDVGQQFAEPAVVDGDLHLEGAGAVGD